jgi:hypothetical protein
MEGRKMKGRRKEETPACGILFGVRGAPYADLGFQGRKEGRKERKEGRKGRKEGRKGRKEGRNKGGKEGIKEGRKAGKIWCGVV